MNAPLVSIGVPLYRSVPYVDNICAAIDSIAYDNLEFVLADRHQLDDAATTLARRYGGDERVRVIATTDQRGWIDNYNSLLREARGSYFRWLAHDDALPETGLARQVALLESNAAAVCVTGPIDRVDANGRPLRAIGPASIRPIAPDIPWTRRHALEVFSLHRYGGAFKALWRRSTIIDNGLFIRRSRDMALPERAWLFAMALQGRFLYDPDYVYRKRLHPDSTSAQWDPTMRHDIDHLARSFGYLTDAVGLPRALVHVPRMAVTGPVGGPLRRRVAQSRAN